MLGSARFAPLALVLGGCSIAAPFEGPGYDPAQGLVTNAEGPFFAVVTKARIRRGEGQAFNAHVEAIQDSLDGQPGLVGSALRAQLGGRDRWTLTVWEDAESLLQFATGEAHLEAMVDADAITDGVWSASWALQPAEVPPGWDEALERLPDED